MPSSVGKGQRRADFADVGSALRAMWLAANSAPERLTAAEYRVLGAVTAEVASWSRLEDHVYVDAIAEAAGICRRNTIKALVSLSRRGLIVWRPAHGNSRGRPRSVLGLPGVRPVGNVAPVDHVSEAETRAQTWPPSATLNMAPVCHPPEKPSEKYLSPPTSPTQEGDPVEQDRGGFQTGMLVPVPGGSAATADDLAGVLELHPEWSRRACDSAIAACPAARGDAVRALERLAADPETHSPGRLNTAHGAAVLAEIRGRELADHRHASELERSRRLIDELRSLPPASDEVRGRAVASVRERLAAAQA